MSAHARALPLELDPLIAEAKQRARRRRWLAVTAAGVVAAAAVATFALRSGGGTIGFCATPPAGWQERSVNLGGGTPPTIVLTNFRFGNMLDNYGLSTSPRPHWPHGGIRIAVEDLTQWRDQEPFRSVAPGILRIDASQFAGFEGSYFPVASRLVELDGRVLNPYVEVRSVTPATVAAVNRALAGVHTCSS
jgi:hypothetical protein